MKKLIAMGSLMLAVMASTPVLADSYLESVGGATVAIAPITVNRATEVSAAMAKDLGPLGAILGFGMGAIGGMFEGAGRTVGAVVGIDS